MVGLLVWTASPLVAILIAVRHAFTRLGEPNVRRELAYFVDGYARHASHWDVLVKRFDLLLTLSVASTSLVPDDAAKVMFFTVQAGFFLVVALPRKSLRWP